jgi:peptidyl-prolyl cis-trans isomerase C
MDLYHSGSMRRFLLFLVLLAVAAGAAACDSSFTPYAAKVNGSTISQSSLNGDLAAITDNAALRSFLASNGAIGGAGVTGTFSAPFEASRLNSAVVDRLVRAELARRHLSVTPLAQTVASCELNSVISQSQTTACPSPAPNPVSTFSPALRSSLIDDQAAIDSLTASLAGYPLTPAGVAAFSKADPAVAQAQCVSIIFTSSEATANQLKTAIDQGAPFATVAKASSLDTSTAPSGGSEGCHPADLFPPPINTVLPTLPIGQVSAPVQYASSQGTTYYLLLQVTARQYSLASAENELIAHGSAAETALVNHLLATADVEINPAYGRWQKVSGAYTVTTNAGPPAQYLGNVNAITPSVTP